MRLCDVKLGMSVRVVQRYELTPRVGEVGLVDGFWEESLVVVRFPDGQTMEYDPEELDPVDWQ